MIAYRVPIILGGLVFFAVTAGLSLAGHQQISKGLDFIFFSSVPVGLVLYFVLKGTATSRWPTTPGVVKESVLGDAPRIRYEYVVDGTIYNSDRLDVLPLEKEWQTSKRRLLNRDGSFRYPAGMNVTVSYHPDRPAEAVLRSGIPRELFGTAFVGCLMVAFVAALMFPSLGWFSAIWLVLLGGLGAMGALMFVFGVSLMRDHRRMKTFPSTTGRVLKTEIVRESGSENEYFYPVIEYDYMIDGRLFRSNKLFSGQTTGSSEARAKKMVSQYPEGAVIDVRYDPALPESAYVQTGSPWTARVTVVIGLVFFAIGLLAIFPSLRPGKLWPAKPERFASPKMEHTSSDLHLTFATEGNVQVPVRLRFDLNTGKPEPRGKTYEHLLPGDFLLPGNALADGKYYIHVSADGFASQLLDCSVAIGQVTVAPGKVTLYRKRYAVIRYAFNPTGVRNLTGPDVQEGRAAVTHWGHLRAFPDWQVWQGGETVTQFFGPVPWLRFHTTQGNATFARPSGVDPAQYKLLVQGNNGFAYSPAGSRFEDLIEAPEPGSYRPTNMKAVPGLLLFCQTWGMTGYQPRTYGKLLVEDVTEIPPADVRIIDGSK